MAVENIRGAIEAILFANGASVEFSRIAQALEISEKKVKEHISALIDDYEASGRGITIILLDNSCQMVSKKEFAPQIRTVMDLRRNTPLSQAALEVLAVVAYNQPVTKAFKIIVPSGTVHAVIDGDKANATLTQDFHNLTDFQIVTTHAAHVLDAQILHIPGFHFFHHC